MRRNQLPISPQTQVSFQTSLITVVASLSLVFAVFMFLNSQRAREFSGPAPRTPERIKYLARRDYLYGAVYAAIQSGDAPLALKRYARYNEVIGANANNAFLADDLGKMLWKQKRLPEARLAFREVLFPPPGAMDSYQRNSVHWRNYAKLCDELHLTDEARAAREQANKLQEEAIRAKKARR